MLIICVEFDKYVTQYCLGRIGMASIIIIIALVFVIIKDFSAGC